MQLLWINLVTDGLPAVALGVEPVEEGVMQESPKPKNEGLFAHGFGLRIGLQGLMIGLLTLAGFFLGDRMTGTVEGGQTLAFMVLALSEIVQAYNMRSDRSLFKIGPFTNSKLNGAAALSILLMALVLFTPISRIFGLVFLPAKVYLIGLALIIAPLPIMEIAKKIRS